MVSKQIQTSVIHRNLMDLRCNSCAANELYNNFVAGNNENIYFDKKTNHPRIKNSRSNNFLSTSALQKQYNQQTSWTAEKVQMSDVLKADTCPHHAH
jgi:hypothetical protein